MRRRILLPVVLSLVLIVTLVELLRANSIDELEPNDTAAQANPLTTGQPISGTIRPAGDVDYYSIPGLNPYWGFIALLDTTGSTSGSDAVLTAYADDGTTLLQSDSGSYERGSVIALQPFASTGITHYLSVSALTPGETITPYQLRYYPTVVRSQPEVESNDTRSAGTPSAYTMAGTISSAADRDCFAFYGRQGNSILLALRAESADLNGVLELVGPDDTVLRHVDQAGAGHNEVMEYGPLAATGAYAYCVGAAAGSSPGGSYKAGIVVDRNLYHPGYGITATWLNRPPAGHYARPGDTLTFELAITNTSPVTIPGPISMGAGYITTCLSYVGASVDPAFMSPGDIAWPARDSALAPGEVYSLTVSLRAERICTDRLTAWYNFGYLNTGLGNHADYSIPNLTYLPTLTQSS